MLLFGDSVTQGCCDGDHLGYRYWIWDALSRSQRYARICTPNTQCNSLSSFKMVGRYTCINSTRIDPSATCIAPNPVTLVRHYPRVREFLDANASYEGTPL